MTETSHRESAKIYQFPPGGRASLGGRREATKPTANLIPAAVSKAAVGSSWYHEAAIEDADQARKR